MVTIYTTARAFKPLRQVVLEGGVVSLEGPESRSRYSEMAAAVDALCPVLDLFRNPVPVERTLASGG